MTPLLTVLHLISDVYSVRLRFFQTHRYETPTISPIRILIIIQTGIYQIITIRPSHYLLFDLHYAKETYPCCFQLLFDPLPQLSWHQITALALLPHLCCSPSLSTLFTSYFTGGAATNWTLDTPNATPPNIAAHVRNKYSKMADHRVPPAV